MVPLGNYSHYEMWYLAKLAIHAGLEPATSAVTGRRSGHLS